MKRDNITKEDILKEIHYNLGIPINYSSKILDTLLELVTEGLNKDNKVKISGFGTFKLLKKKSRIGRNPKTRQEYNIKARNVVTFYPSLQVKKRINLEE